VPTLLLTVSKGGGPHFDGACAIYTERIARYTSFSELQLKPNPKGAAANDAAAQRAAEGERLLRHVADRDRLVLLDERGRDLSSEGLAELVAAAGDEGVSSLIFAIGGPFGHSDAVKARADITLRLSAMVLNHQVARLVLAEQLYRAWTILRKEGYHHGT
jgi:23S rRNA (pseudouridine1915-N3)-methyltransferase